MKLRFKNGAYIRELEIKEQGKAAKWLNIIPTFRGRREVYTEKTEPLKLVLQPEDYRSSEDYIRHMYTESKWDTEELYSKVVYG